MNQQNEHHISFAERAKKTLESESLVTGLAVGGSWLTGELDEYSDLDMIVVTTEKITGHKTRMLHYASKLGRLLSGFTGEHVGEPRVLICLYDDPLLHVDIKFVTIKEFRIRVEDPEILLDKEGQLKTVLSQFPAAFPYPDYQWIEDRFWTWIHYTTVKAGRGEYLEAFDMLGYLRMIALGPLLHIKNNNLPRGVRKAEAMLPNSDLELLKGTIPSYSKASILSSLQNCVSLYRSLRKTLFNTEIHLQERTEKRVIQYLAIIRET